MVLDAVITAAFGSAAVAAASALDPPRKPSEASWRFKLGLCIVAWFASSALCSFGTKNTLNSLAPQSCAVGLTTLQFIFSAVIGGAICLVTRQSVPRGCWLDMGRIALVYTLGFLFFNMSYGRLAASFAETVRGLEPLFSFAFVRQRKRTLPPPLPLPLPLPTPNPEPDPDATPTPNPNLNPDPNPNPNPNHTCVM